MGTILEALCRATGAACCELQIRILPDGVIGRYRYGTPDHGEAAPLVIQAEAESGYEARWELCGAGGGPAASPRALDALQPVLEGSLVAVIERWNATRQLEILAQILGITEDAIFLIDAGDEIRYANAEGEQLLSLHTEKPLARVTHDDKELPLWDLLIGEVAALRAKEQRTRHVSVRVGDGETWDVEIIGFSGPGSLGHTLVVLSRVRVLGPEQIRARLERYGVSHRESEVLALVLNGMKACEIAERLEISEYTVKDHLKHAYAKLGISSRTQLVSRLTSDGALSL